VGTHPTLARYLSLDGRNGKPPLPRLFYQMRNAPRRSRPSAKPRRHTAEKLPAQGVIPFFQKRYRPPVLCTASLPILTVETAPPEGGKIRAKGLSTIARRQSQIVVDEDAGGVALATQILFQSRSFQPVGER